jgi:hypothetical protein
MNRGGMVYKNKVNKRILIDALLIDYLLLSIYAVALFLVSPILSSLFQQHGNLNYMVQFLW